MQIHVSRDGQQFGPYTLEEIRQYLSAGSLSPSDSAWHEGLADWQPLGALVNPAAVPPPPPPAAPPARPVLHPAAQAGRPEHTEEEPIHVYPYQHKLWLGILVLAFCGAGVWVIGHEALTDSRGMIINHIIKLSPGGATIFRWMLTLCSAAGAMAGVAMIFDSLSTPRLIQLTATTLTAPRGSWTRETVTIRHRSIQQMDVWEQQSRRWLQVEHPGGELKLYESMFKNKETFEEFCETLSSLREQ